MTVLLFCSLVFVFSCLFHRNKSIVCMRVCLCGLMENENLLDGEYYGIPEKTPARPATLCHSNHGVAVRTVSAHIYHIAHNNCKSNARVNVIIQL